HGQTRRAAGQEPAPGKNPFGFLSLLTPLVLAAHDARHDVPIYGGFGAGKLLPGDAPPGCGRHDFPFTRQPPTPTAPEADPHQAPRLRPSRGRRRAAPSPRWYGPNRRIPGRLRWLAGRTLHRALRGWLASLVAVAAWAGAIGVGSSPSTAFEIARKESRRQ